MPLFQDMSFYWFKRISVSNLEGQAVSRMSNFICTEMSVALPCTVLLEMNPSELIVSMLYCTDMKGMNLKTKYECTFIEAESFSCCTLLNLLSILLY